MYTLPVLELEEIPFRLDDEGRLQPCRLNNEAVLVDFAIVVVAKSANSYEIDRVWMGTQELSGKQLRRFAQILADAKSDDIRDHVVDHLPSREDAAYDAREAA